ncbi:MAG: hypothetical protein AAF466_05215 [Bacteroidota bacterium]
MRKFEESLCEECVLIGGIRITQSCHTHDIEIVLIDRGIQGWIDGIIVEPVGDITKRTIVEMLLENFVKFFKMRLIEDDSFVYGSKDKMLM